MKIHDFWWFSLFYIFYKYVQLTNTDHPHMCGRPWRAHETCIAMVGVMPWGAGQVKWEHRPHGKSSKMSKNDQISMKINENSWFLMIFNIYIFYKYVQLTNTDHPHMCGRRWRATKGALRWWVSCQRRPRTWERSGRRRMNVFVE